MPTTILQPGQIEAGASAIPELRLPTANQFVERARRFEQLAEGHKLGDWLRFLAALCRAQHDALPLLAQAPLPDADLLQRCRDYAMPPLAPPGWRRDPTWRAALRAIAGAVIESAPAVARNALRDLQAAPDDWLDVQADRLLAAEVRGLDLSCSPIIGAALQTSWSALAGRLRPADIARPEHPNLCPVCGSRPAAAVVRIGGAENGLRYLHCGLCSSEWHVVRAKCSHCDNGQGIAYLSIAGGDETVRAETCPACHGYLKQVHQDRDPQAEPLADDLASLALDILVGEEGFAKTGMNLLLVNVEG